MEFQYAYSRDSRVDSDPTRSDLSFAPDTLRQPTFFRGSLRKQVAFREAIGALHEVVVSDLRWHPKDRSAYKAWAAQQEELDWAAVAAQRREVAAQVETVRRELIELRQRRDQRLQPFYQARRRYFDYLYRTARDFWFVLDPVITVHPDEVFFECFSQDESSYGRLGANFDVFQDIDEFACGTTNIDYSAALYDEFQKIRSYKTTMLEIDPSGFQTRTSGEAAYKEVKIDLPDSWVRGLLQVNSAMSLPAVRFNLHPMDLHNLCFVLRRRKEKVGPRSMRYLLRPGHPVKVVFDPWNIEVPCPRSIYGGDGEHEIRVWGRRRIHILERLIPLARRFTVHLLGYGLPSFYIADLRDLTFTLGLSGWTANDWSTSGNFDLLAPRADVDGDTQRRVFDALQEKWFAAPEALAAELELDRAVVLGALSASAQAGRAMWDLNKQVYRSRELRREPLPVERLRFSNEREAAANRWVGAGGVQIREVVDSEVTRAKGTVNDGTRAFETSLVIDSDERLIEAACTCNFHQQNRLRKGPCEHILALRIALARQRRPRALARDPV